MSRLVGLVEVLSGLYLLPHRKLIKGPIKNMIFYTSPLMNKQVLSCFYMLI